MIRIGLRHWLVALVIALAVHAALLIRFQVEDTLAGANVGQAGVRIALAPKQGKPQPEQVAANASEQTDTPEPKPKPEPTPESVPEPTPEPTPGLAPKPKPQPKPEEEPQPKPEPGPEPKPKRKRAPKPEPASQPQRQEPEPAPSEPSRPARRADNAQLANGQDRTNAPAQGAQTAERTQPGTTGSVSDTPADYRSEFSAWLQRYKNYPRRARRLHQEGTVVLHFVMDQSGHVLDWEIRKSSGHKLLDDAVRDMIRQADPLPALPDSVSMQRLALTVPVRFQLR